MKRKNEMKKKKEMKMGETITITTIMTEMINILVKIPV
jgi:hypothetical protein